MSDTPPVTASLLRVPLFPLPNVVLLPRAVLPLHIFEERYKEMTADALAGDRQIAMALLQPGWENSYHGRAEIEPAVCIGTIVSFEKLPDGKYNILLQGHTRGRVRREVALMPYRIGEIEPLAELSVMEIDLDVLRQKLRELFTGTALGSTGLGRQLLRMLGSPLPTADIADIAAFNLLDDIALKQSLLSQVDVRLRVERTIDALKKLDRLMSIGNRVADPGVN